MPADLGRSRPQRLWLAAAATLVAVVVAGTGWLAVRAATTAGPAPLGSTAATVARDAANGTAAIRAQPQPGPSHRTDVAGVAWGWPLTADGAAAAAMTAHVELSRPDVVIDPDRVDDLATVMFTEREADRQRRLAETLRTELEVSGWFDQPASRRMYHVAPLAVSVPSWDADAGRATVQIWSLQLVGVGDLGGASFVTSTVTLQVIDGDWRLSDTEAVEGPTPFLQSRPNAPGLLRAFLHDAVPLTAIPMTVDQ